MSALPFRQIFSLCLKRKLPVLLFGVDMRILIGKVLNLFYML